MFFVRFLCTSFFPTGWSRSLQRGTLPGTLLIIFWSCRLRSLVTRLFLVLLHEVVSLAYCCFFFFFAFFFIVTEYLDGGDLWEQLEKRGRFREVEAKGIVKSLLRTVRFIHSNNVCHRDIKVRCNKFICKTSLFLSYLHYSLSIP